MNALVERLAAIVGPDHVWEHERVPPDDTHDESLTGEPVVPLAVVRPRSTEEVSRVLRLADEQRVPVVARGSGTGLSGGARPMTDGIVVAFDRMARVIEVDEPNQVAVVQPGVTLAQLDDVLRPLHLVYPVHPGEMSGSLGGNVATNAGGMRAVRYGVTRHNVLGLEVVLAGGDVMRTGGRFVKCSTGYDLTQLVVGSEGTLALVTEATLKLVPRLRETVTLLAPFSSLQAVTAAVVPLLHSGATPLILEYIDTLAMSAIAKAAGIDVGVPDHILSSALAYLVVVLESTHVERLEQDVEAAAALLGDVGALDVYVLPSTAGADLIAARERAFYVSKAAGAHDIVDTVVPRASIPAFLTEVTDLASRHGALVSACGHVGDGNVHLSIFLADEQRRARLLHDVYAAARRLGGAVSGEHGIGTEKLRYFLDLEDPVKLALMRRLKAAFDPHGILGPGRLLGPERPAEVERTSAPGEAVPS